MRAIDVMIAIRHAYLLARGRGQGPPSHQHIFHIRSLVINIRVISRLVYHYLRIPTFTPRGLTQVSVALQEFLNIWPLLDTIDQLSESWVLLESGAAILSQLFIVADLVDNKIGVGDLLTNDEWSRLRKLIATKMLVECLKEVCSVTLLVLRVELVLVWREEGNDKESSP